MVQVKVKGQDVWDDSDRLAFLEEMVKRDILPKLPKEIAAAVSAEEKNGSNFSDFAAASGEAEDDF